MGSGFGLMDLGWDARSVPIPAGGFLSGPHGAMLADGPVSVFPQWRGVHGPGTRLLCPPRGSPMRHWALPHAGHTAGAQQAPSPLACEAGMSGSPVAMPWPRGALSEGLWGRNPEIREQGHPRVQGSRGQAFPFRSLSPSPLFTYSVSGLSAPGDPPEGWPGRDDIVNWAPSSSF